jgi:hypothetical protein
MANLLKGFLDNVFKGTLNPKGNLADFAHASRLYVDDSFRLAPKQKFLYHVVFNINPQAKVTDPPLSNHQRELNMLVKSVDLPQYTVDMVTAQQYNVKRKIQTKISYDPINITFHDDNYGVTTALWETYYRYYYNDGNYGSKDTQGNQSTNTNRSYSKSGGLTNNKNTQNKFGLDNDANIPFFTSIQIYQMARKTYTCYTLVNPIVQRWQHDTMNNQESGPVQNQMTVEYEAVFYSRGRVQANGAPAGFGQEHYDKTPSPNSLSGGGSTSLLGTGGILSGLFGANDGPYTYIGSQLGGGRGGITLGSIIRTANRLKNAKNLSKEGLKQEGFNILTGAIGRIGNTADQAYGVPNTFIGRSASNIGSGLKAVTKALIRNR